MSNPWGGEKVWMFFTPDRALTSFRRVAIYG